MNPPAGGGMVMSSFPLVPAAGYAELQARGPMAAFLNVPIRRQQILLFVVDLVLLFISLALAFIIARLANFNVLPLIQELALASIIYFCIYTLVFFVGQIYDVESRYDEMRSFLYIAMLVGFANLLIVSVYHFMPYYRMAWRVVAIQAPLAIIFIYLWRRLYAMVSRRLMPARKVVVLGAGGALDSVLGELSQGVQGEFALAGIVDGSGAAASSLAGVPILGSAADLKEIVARERISTIVFSPGYRSRADGRTIRDLLDLKAQGVQVCELPTFYTRLTGRVPVRLIEDHWLLFSQDFAGIARADERNLKRLMDVVIAAGALTLLSPLMAIVAAAIRLTSPGPALYRQERVGLNRRSYQILKFRTMRADAESSDGPVWASPNDRRVTRVGKWLRRFRLDETPQFFNVLKGEMSVIGPRPERPHFIDVLERDIPYYSLRFAARPGMTGWAQVNYSYGRSVEDAHTKLQYDLYYIQEMSPFLDMVILLKTLQTLLFRPGA